VYGTQNQVVYTSRDQVVYPTQGQVQGGDCRDDLYQFDASRVPEDPYGMNPSQYVDNTRDTHAVPGEIVEDSRNCTQGQDDPAKENIFIYEHYSG
jgi:hypothetical protein